MPNTEQEWASKLVGKKYHEGQDVSANKAEDTFTRSDLPEKTRVLPPGYFATMDWVEDRLNVHLDDKGVCTHVKMG